MRNPNRLYGFYDKLREIHMKQVPDWRFGQFISNIFQDRDIFYLEENEMIEIIEEYFCEIYLENEEEKELKEFLYKNLDEMSIYHEDLAPNPNDSLDNLIESYCYWADNYNAGYMPEIDEQEDRLSRYMVQKFKQYI